MDQRIAAGGVGQVWRATDLLLERPVAVKVLRPEYADHPETLDRFSKEARHAGALSHPHVAAVYDYGPAGPGWPPYLVMELVNGPSLADILAVEPVEPVFALDVIAQAAEGLSAAHRAGLVHRDVKPGNILISSEGLVKVTDFGIAHAVGQAPVTGPNTVMGTTQYMAPERIAGDQGSPASDLYALGIVLHECLTGEPPYEGAPADIMAAHLYSTLPPLPAGLPPALGTLIARLTVKDPADRISDARELAVAAAGLRDAIDSGRLAPVTRTAARSVSAPVPAGSPAAGGSGPPWSGSYGSDTGGSRIVPGRAGAGRPGED
ncbi:MAG TPA: serine/threonine-protein kinase, partial [Trebonia sp.]